MRKAAAQAGFPAAVVEVGDESGGVIAVGSQVLGERGMVPSRGESQSAVSSWGHRPVNRLLCDGRVQGAVANA